MLRDILADSTFFGVAVSLVGYEIGIFLKNKLKLAVFNPLLVATVLVILFLKLVGVDYDTYNEGGKYLSYFLTPATVCLAIPLYQQLDLLKSNLKAILLGILSGVIASLGSVFLFALAFGLNHEQYVTMLPKSITTAIGMGMSEELGGLVTITVASIIITGILGNVIAETVCKVFHITNPVAKGIGIGSASHAIGTARAIEMGEVEGAMSGLAIAVAGLMTVVGANIFANFI
jgi:predicted murein hydrolase (TIGR00659 family)